MSQGQVLNYCTKEQTATHHNTYSWKIRRKFISFYRLQSLLLKHWVGYPSMSRYRGDGNKDGGKDFILPLCIQVSLCAKWSCRTMTKEGPGWAERRWVDLSRSFCVCHCQSSLEIPATTVQGNYNLKHFLWCFTTKPEITNINGAK